MSNTIDENGIQIQTLAEIVDEMVNGSVDVPGFKQIYGPDINVDSNSPDGQMINIYALSKEDILNLCVGIYDSFDPDQAVGVALDSISQLCGVARKGGTYTTTNVTITLDRSTTLDGLDTSITPFTVADSEGNQFYLEETTTQSAGAHALSFRAALVGEVQVLPNTITVPVTIILGVTAINNPSSPTQTGINQETDSQFRIRRQKSVAGPSQGYLASLFAGLNNINGMDSAVVYENITNSTDGSGIPAHSIWVVVDGGTDDEVADVIYRYRNAGCGMKGDEEVDVIQIDDSVFVVKFDRATDNDLSLKFHVDTINGGSIDEDAIKAYLVANWIFTINEPADITTMAELVRASNPNAVVSCGTGEGVSNNGSDYESVIYPTTKAKKFVLEVGNIDIT